MAKPKNSGNLSGAIGNVVFVSKGSYTYARSKPAKVKQTASTKVAARTFGWVSQQDKKFRFALAQTYTLITDSYYAARHRASMAKALNPSVTKMPPPAPNILSMPQALEGFEFNTQLPWTKTCRFYLEFTQSHNTMVQCQIPAIALGQNLKPPKAVSNANIQLHAFMVDPNKPDIDLIPISSHEISLLPNKTVPETLWSFNLPTYSAWLLVLGTVTFEFRQATIVTSLRGCSTYLFTKVVQENG